MSAIAKDEYYNPLTLKLERKMQKFDLRLNIADTCPFAFSVHSCDMLVSICPSVYINRFVFINLFLTLCTYCTVCTVFCCGLNSTSHCKAWEVQAGTRLCEMLPRAK